MNALSAIMPECGLNLEPAVITTCIASDEKSLHGIRKVLHFGRRFFRISSRCIAMVWLRP